MRRHLDGGLMQVWGHVRHLSCHGNACPGKAANAAFRVSTDQPKLRIGMASADFWEQAGSQQDRGVHIGLEPHISGEENDPRSLITRRSRSDRGTVYPVGDNQDLSS